MPTGKNSATFNSTPTCMSRSRSRSRPSRFVRSMVGGAGSDRGARASSGQQRDRAAHQERPADAERADQDAADHRPGDEAGQLDAAQPAEAFGDVVGRTCWRRWRAPPAGTARSTDPTTPRATTKPSSDDDPANSTLPSTATSQPGEQQRFEWPRSASGASSSWPTKPTTMPDPAIRPRPESAKPYVSCRSDSTENTTLLAMPTAAVAARSAYQPSWPC